MWEVKWRLDRRQHIDHKFLSLLKHFFLVLLSHRVISCLTSTCFLWASHLHPIQPVKVIAWYLRPDALVPWLTTGSKVNMLHNPRLQILKNSNWKQKIKINIVFSFHNKSSDYDICLSRKYLGKIRRLPEILWYRSQLTHTIKVWSYQRKNGMNSPLYLMKHD